MLILAFLEKVGNACLIRRRRDIADQTGCICPTRHLTIPLFQKMIEVPLNVRFANVIFISLKSSVLQTRINKTIEKGSVLNPQSAVRRRCNAVKIPLECFSIIIPNRMSAAMAMSKRLEAAKFFVFNSGQCDYLSLMQFIFYTFVFNKILLYIGFIIKSPISSVI